MNPSSQNLEFPRAAPAGTWRLDARTGDAHSQARVQPEWQQEYRQLSPGLFQGHVQHVQLPGMRLVREDSNQALHHNHRAQQPFNPQHQQGRSLHVESSAVV
jgi:hypothetical protein